MTITIKRQHNNDISVDLVPTIPWSRPLNIHGWPRKNSRKVFNQNIVKDVEKKGLHLVPKGDETWTISYSKAEEELLANIDDGNQCRKEIMKFLKYYLDVCKSQSADGLAGLSSYIIKVITYNYIVTQYPLDMVLQITGWTTLHKLKPQEIACSKMKLNWNILTHISRSCKWYAEHQVY